MMAQQSQKQKRSSDPVLTILWILIVLCLVLAVVLGALGIYLRTSDPIQVPEPTAPTVMETQAPPPVPVSTADGQPDSLLYRNCYSIIPSQSAPEKTVVSLQGQTLNNGALQIYYLNAIRTHQLSGTPEAPDYTQPLETQLCPLVEGNLSWQHYFLKKAIEAWQKETLLLLAAQEPRPITDEAFTPDEIGELHEKLEDLNLPVLSFLYSDQPCYRPNSMHQAYLDDLEDRLDQLARQQGYASLADCVESTFGMGVDSRDLVSAAIRYNTAYMFFTEESYDLPVTDEEVAAYVKAHRQALPDGGERTVELRHVLLIPDGALIGDDGTVTATEAQWEACQKKAESVLQSWQWEYLNNRGKNYNFARLANQQSQDLGSRVNGGLYQNIRPGQLIAPLDDWCFDPGRKAEDIAILRSQLGYHIVFFCGVGSPADKAARQAVTEEKMLSRWEDQLQKAVCQVDYSAVQLWVEVSQPSLAPVDVLYPDIAHQRFPEVMVYFQHDYMFSPYGGSYVGRGGCGITTFAMLSTYMTDTIQTPHALAARYPDYHDKSGTRGELFEHAPAELGFFLAKKTASTKEVIEALENGQMVVSLQTGGDFTSGGHYLLLQDYYPESDTFQVRDSNIYNYTSNRKTQPGHTRDSFSRQQIESGGCHFYIMEKKITTIPACARCGDGSAPEKLLNQDCLCPKCEAALSRRNTFLDWMG